jgi:hypothetical protein
MKRKEIFYKLIMDQSTEDITDSNLDSSNPDLINVAPSGPVEVMPHSEGAHLVRDHRLDLVQIVSTEAATKFDELNVRHFYRSLNLDE